MKGRTKSVLCVPTALLRRIHLPPHLSSGFFTYLVACKRGVADAALWYLTWRYLWEEIFAIWNLITKFKIPFFCIPYLPCSRVLSQHLSCLDSLWWIWANRAMRSPNIDSERRGWERREEEWIVEWIENHDLDICNSMKKRDHFFGTKIGAAGDLRAE